MASELFISCAKHPHGGSGMPGNPSITFEAYGGDSPRLSIAACARCYFEMLGQQFSEHGVTHTIQRGDSPDGGDDGE